MVSPSQIHIKAYTTFTFRAEQKHLDPTDYIIENLSRSSVCKPPGSIRGQQFVIRNCEDSSIFLLDYSDSIIVDDCQRCTLVLGPTKQRFTGELICV